jgi:hypothetical protein
MNMSDLAATKQDLADAVQQLTEAIHGSQAEEIRCLKQRVTSLEEKVTELRASPRFCIPSRRSYQRSGKWPVSRFGIAVSELSGGPTGCAEGVRYLLFVLITIGVPSNPNFSRSRFTR